MARLAAGATGEIWDESFAWDFQPGQNVTVSCYANADAVELLLNGRSLGTRALTEDDCCRATFALPFEPGELLARAYRESALVATDTLRTPGKAAQIALTASVEGDIAQVEACLLDADGVPVVLHDQRLHVAAEGATLLGVESGDRADLTAYAEPHRKTWQGQAIVYLRLIGANDARLTVAGEGGLTSAVTVGRKA